MANYLEMLSAPFSSVARSHVLALIESVLRATNIVVMCLLSSVRFNDAPFNVQCALSVDRFAC